jgi:hypothetical protein
MHALPSSNVNRAPKTANQKLKNVVSEMEKLKDNKHQNKNLRT